MTANPNPLFPGLDKIASDQLQEIARKSLGIEVLETRNSDSLDFYDVGVGCVRRALQEAYEAGRRTAKQ